VVTDVHLECQCPAPERLDLLARALEIVRTRDRVRRVLDLPRVAQVDQREIGALLGEPQCMTAALPARGPGDEDDLVLEPSHDKKPSFGQAL
jgi:hypothetical protein